MLFILMNLMTSFIMHRLFYCLSGSSFFEKIMTYSGLVSGYIWSKKARKKDNLIFFLSKTFFKIF
jgi:hypothetical protein